ncbi:MAG TPA: hypothetical protein PK691_00695 [Thermomicrobiales bacterium]|nr:hypothetical protein [Thermomicrobiales bacterium]HRA46748.1 hypothetical protein [Thermomicrobiales bacterium]
MKTNLTQMRALLRGRFRSVAACPDHIMDGERTDRDLALLAQAEREYRTTTWQRRSILGGDRS